jgi:hypothetical protein
VDFLGRGSSSTCNCYSGGVAAKAVAAAPAAAADREVDDQPRVTIQCAREEADVGQSTKRKALSCILRKSVINEGTELERSRSALPGQEKAWKCDVRGDKYRSRLLTSQTVRTARNCGLVDLSRCRDCV